MARADHVFVERLRYRHPGIGTGCRTVIHYVGKLGDKYKAAIREISETIRRLIAQSTSDAMVVLALAAVTVRRTSGTPDAPSA